MFVIVSKLDPKNYIDVTKDSLQDCLAKLYGRAYKNNVPKGGIDVPANLMMGQVQEEYADYSITHATHSGQIMLSADPDLVPPVRKPEPVAKHSEPPFSHPFQDAAPGGIFGKALTAHSKLMSAVHSLGKDKTDLEHSFKAQWGIDENQDLNEFYARPRSVGPALWGGIKRSTVPANLSMTGSQTLVQIVDHGVTRKDIDPNALVDWPRAKSIAQAIGTQLVADDNKYKQNPKDIHMRIHRAFVPKAPDIVNVPRLEKISEHKIKITLEAIVKLSAHMRRLFAIKKHQFGRVSNDAVEPKSILHAVRALPTGFIDKPKGKLFDDIQEISFETLEGLGSKLTQEEREAIKDVQPFDIIKAFAISYAEAKHGQAMRVYDLRKIIAGLDNDPVNSLQSLQGLIKSVVPSDILVRTYFLGNIVRKGQGVNWVIELRKFLKFKHSAFSEEDLKLAWIQSLDNIHVVKRVAEEISFGFAYHEYASMSQPHITPVIRRKLAHPTSFLQGLDELVERHAVYWHNRYLATVPEQYDLAIKKQIAAKVFKNIQINLTKDGSVEVPNKVINEVLHDSAYNYVLKKLPIKSEVKADLLSKAYDGDPHTYARQLDDDLNKHYKLVPDTPYINVAVYITEGLTKFTEDFIKIIETVMVRDPLPLTEDYLTNTFVELKKDSPKSEDSFQIELKENAVKPPAVKPGKVELPKQDSFFDFGGDEEEEEGFGDFGGLGQVQKQLVDLEAELAESGIDVKHPIAMQVIQKEPREVEYREVEFIREKILKKMTQRK